MATKHTDGCFQKAEDDEPLFTLLARDPLAPILVRLWAALRRALDLDGYEEAMLVAAQMEVWRLEHRPEKMSPSEGLIRRVVASARWSRRGALEKSVLPSALELGDRIANGPQQGKVVSAVERIGDSRVRVHFTNGEHMDVLRAER